MKAKNFVLLFLVSFLVFTIFGCTKKEDQENTDPINNHNYDLVIKDADKGTVLSGSIVMALNEEINLGFNSDEIKSTINYSTDNQKIVSVEESKIKAVGPGHTKINGRVTYEGKNYLASFDVTVISVELRMSKNVDSIELGETLSVDAVCLGAQGEAIISSSNPDIISVEAKTLKALKVGASTIKASFTYEGKTVEAEKELTVTYNPPLVTYTVTFKDFDQRIIEEQVVEEGHAAIAPEDPDRLGYRFTGWSRSFDNVTSNISVLARYTIIEYPIKFLKNSESEDIQMPNDMTYTVEKEITLPTPTAPFRFVGWFLDASGEGEAITKIAKGTVDEITLYAVWDEEDWLYCSIRYVYDEGKPVEHVCKDIDEFSEQFFKELYAWSGSTLTLENFKNECLSKWKAGNQYNAAKVYSGGNPEVVLEDYFVSAEDNYKRWMPWMMEFDKQVNNINHDQSAWNSTYVGYLRLYSLIMKSASYWTAARVEPLYKLITVPEILPTLYTVGDEFDIPGLMIDDGREFLGWVDENNNVIDKVTKDTKGNLVLYATWSNSTPIESIEIVKPERIEKYDTYQLTWTFNPENTTNKRLNFISSDPSVLAISAKGLITTYKEGKVSVTVEVLADQTLNQTFEIEVFVNPFIDGKYSNTSILAVNETESLIITKYNFDDNVVWSSSNDAIATVVDGLVTAVNPGYATITVKSANDENIKFDFGITVKSGDSDFTIIENAHNQDSFIRRDLNVAYAYLTDVILSASDLLYNFDYQINRDYEAIQAQHSENHSGKRPSTEFITVHYTAGYQKSSTAKATASYFANGGSSSSIHYTTGNDGIYHILDDSLIGWHAGDGAGESVAFYWINTGVKAQGYIKPIWGVIKDSNSSTGYYFTLNGEATTISVPVSGKTSAGNDISMKDPSKCFTYFGPAWKVVDGYYYMGNTWACFTQTLAGAISSRGGNRNSVGIESACNQGSDLWYTYQITAQLVAHLLQTYNLDFYRVVGHNAFSGKDCPQTLLANNGELWELFMDCVRREYELLTTMSNYTITAKSNNPELLQDNGRILAIPKYSTSVSYTVTVKNNTTGEEKEQTFSTIIHGWYTE